MKQTGSFLFPLGLTLLSIGFDAVEAVHKLMVAVSIKHLKDDNNLKFV